MPTDQELLAQWADFPVDASPRPLVLIDGYVHVQERGFVNGEAKRAFIAGAIAPEVDVPAAVLDLFERSDATYDGRPLRVTSLRVSTGIFRTDRGPRELPAYELDILGAAQPVLVLDPSTAVWWPARPSADPPDHAGPTWIEDDGRTLHVPAGGSVLTEFLRCELVETATAVLARPVTGQQHAEPGAAIPSVLIMKRVSGRLHQPLGARVLIDQNGRPMAVIPRDQAGN